MQVFLQTTYHKYYNYACINNQQKITRLTKRAKNKCYETRKPKQSKHLKIDVFFFSIWKRDENRELETITVALLKQIKYYVHRN